MSYQNLRSLSPPRGCKVLKQVSADDPQPLGDKPIHDRIGYIMSIHGLSAREKALLALLSSQFMRVAMFRASTKWLSGKLSCSRPTFHKVLKGLEGRWLLVRRYPGNQSVYGPASRFANVIRRCQMKQVESHASTRKAS